MMVALSTGELLNQMRPLRHLTGSLDCLLVVGLGARTCCYAGSEILRFFVYLP